MSKKNLSSARIVGVFLSGEAFLQHLAYPTYHPLTTVNKNEVEAKFGPFWLQFTEFLL